MLRSPWRRLAALLLAAGLAVLHAGNFRASFLNDDLVFLEQARSTPLLRSLGQLDALGNYWRPLSREAYFAALGATGGGPVLFHVVNFAAFLGALALLADLLAAFASGPAVFAGVLFFALLPFQAVNLLWISCAQDVFALAFTLAAVALWRRERRGWALAAWLAALASKESALPLPLALFAWDLFVAKRDAALALRRQVPMLAAGLAWGVLGHVIRTRAHSHAPLAWRIDTIPAVYAHLVQSLFGIEHPPEFLPAFASHTPAWLPLVLLAVAAGLVAAPRVPAAASAPAEPPAPTAILPFALAWIAAFAIVVWPVVHEWSGYYFTLAAAGGAMLVAWFARGIGRAGLVALAVVLLWWNAAGTAVQAFAVTPDPWGWTSHLTPGYFRREEALVGGLGASLRRLEPAPPHGTRFFFARLPSYAGFQSGNGALLRSLYRDPSLESYFYSQFRDSTAGDHPCRFLWWDGAEIRPLYPGAADPFFQVGCDLLLLDRPRGALHAFRRSLATGGSREDDLYWLGWALLWSGERDGAESAWRQFGAHDDPAEWNRNFTAVRTTLYERRDTLTARRELNAAIRAGIGQPHTHAILGEVMAPRGGIDTKYGLLELMVAGRLNPNDLLARRELVVGLAAIGLGERALAELDAMKPLDAGWRADSVLVSLERRLRAAPAAPEGVVTFR